MMEKQLNDVKVSIVCTTYNHEKFIEDALKGFFSQKTNFKYEIIVHDDASTDHTVDIVKKYMSKYPGVIKPIFQEKNLYQQHISSMDYFYPKISGKYVAYCEGDDFWIDESKLQKQFDYMEEHPDCSMCCHNSYFFDDIYKRRRGKVCKDIGNIKIDIEYYLEHNLCGENINPTASNFLRKEFVKYPHYKKYFSFGDLFTDLQVLSHGYVYHMEDVMAVYRINNSGSYCGRINQLPPTEKIYKWMEYHREILQALDYFNFQTEFKWNDSIIRCKNRIFSEILCKESFRYEIIKNSFFKNVYIAFKESKLGNIIKSLIK